MYKSPAFIVDEIFNSFLNECRIKFIGNISHVNVEAKYSVGIVFTAPYTITKTLVGPEK